MKTFLLLFCTLPFFFACSSSDDDNGTGLIGEWEFIKISPDIVTGSSELTEKMIKQFSSDREYFGNIEFTEDGIYRHFNVIDNRWEKSKYVIKGNTLTIFGDKSEISLKGNSLKIWWDEAEFYKESYPEANVKKAIYRLEYTRLISE